MRFGGVVFVMASRTNNILIHLPQHWPITVAYPVFFHEGIFRSGEGQVIFGRFCEKADMKYKCRNSDDSCRK